MTLYKTFLTVAIALEIPFIPMFLKAAWPKKCIKSLALKMICASLFVISGFLCVAISGNYTDYAKYIIIGLIFGWFGDLFLHILSDKIIFFLLGLFSFLIGHVFYIRAYIFQITSITGITSFINIYEAMAAAAILGAVLIYSAVKKINYGPIIVPGILYASALTLMLVKATSLGLTLIRVGAPYAPLAFLMLFIGALFFLLSDLTLAYIYFSGKERNFKLKVFNIVTYFSAQVLLASSILIIGI